MSSPPISFSHRLFDADIQIPDTELQALLPFLAPPPERLTELARRLYLKLLITGARDDLYEHFITKNRLAKVGNNHRNLDLFYTIVYSRPEALRDFLYPLHTRLGASSLRGSGGGEENRGSQWLWKMIVET